MSVQYLYYQVTFILVDVMVVVMKEDPLLIQLIAHTALLVLVSVLIIRNLINQLPQIL